jgi:hypothetical protein
MAAKKKKKKTKKASRPAKARKAPARKSKAKKAAKRPAKKAKKTVKAAAKKAPAKKAIAAVPKKKAPARKKKQTGGEGDYEATRKFDRDEAGFVAKNKANIPAMGKEAEAALDGPEGAALREAEASGLARSRDTF